MTVPLVAGLLVSDILVWGSGALTAVVGLAVAALAYRGYRRNGARKMRALAVGIGLLTAGAFLAAALASVAGAGDGVALLARGLVTVAGLCAVLYALLRG